MNKMQIDVWNSVRNNVRNDNATSIRDRIWNSLSTSCTAMLLHGRIWDSVHIRINANVRDRTYRLIIESLRHV